MKSLSTVKEVVLAEYNSKKDGLHADGQEWAHARVPVLSSRNRKRTRRIYFMVLEPSSRVASREQGIFPRATVSFTCQQKLVLFSTVLYALRPQCVWIFLVHAGEMGKWLENSDAFENSTFHVLERKFKTSKDRNSTRQQPPQRFTSSEEQDLATAAIFLLLLANWSGVVWCECDSQACRHGLLWIRHAEGPLEERSSVWTQRGMQLEKVTKG
jgi:hypothetical protein